MTGLRIQQYAATSGRKLAEGRKAIANGPCVTLLDSYGVVLTRNDLETHDNALRVAREWVA